MCLKQSGMELDLWAHCPSTQLVVKFWKQLLNTAASQQSDTRQKPFLRASYKVRHLQFALYQVLLQLQVFVVVRWDQNHQPGTVHKEKHLITSVKYGPGSVMLWASFFGWWFSMRIILMFWMGCPVNEVKHLNMENFPHVLTSFLNFICRLKSPTLNTALESHCYVERRRKLM